jgi:hypothetical protein
MNSHSDSNDLDLLAAEIVVEIDCLLAQLQPPTQTAATQTVQRVSNAMWDQLTTLPNYHTHVPPYPRPPNHPMEHNYMYPQPAQVQRFNDEVAEFIASLRASASAPPSGPTAPGTGGDFEEVD